MKTPTILIALTFLIFTDSFSQKVTYKNLRGTGSVFLKKLNLRLVYNLRIA